MAKLKISRSADPLNQGHQLFVHIKNGKATVQIGMQPVGEIDIHSADELAELLLFLASNDFYNVIIKHETIKEWDRVRGY